MRALRSDHHIHTRLSGHASEDLTPANIVRRAAAAGLARIVILEHAPAIPREKALVLGKRTGAIPAPQIGEIAREVAALRADSPVRVLVGAEVDADPHQRDGRLLVDCPEADVVLASTHYLPGLDALWYESVGSPGPERLDQLYRDWMVWAMHIAANPAVDVLAHPGVEMAAVGAIRRFAGAVLEDFEKLLRVCARYGTAIEINELFASKVTAEQAESYVAVVALARDLGVRLSLASDAHSLDRIGAYTWVASVVDRLGLTADQLYHPGA